MFTGIIKELGVVSQIINKGLSKELVIHANLTGDLRPGDSVSVNGVCLTVTNVSGNEFKAEAVSETLQKTTIGNLKIRDKVNLEPALKSGESFGGHMVNGHVDGACIIRDKIQKGDASTFEFFLPTEIRHLSKYIADKGPIAVDGISLTVVEAKTYSFSISVIPFTLESTTLGFRRIGDRVNLEVDIIAKYVQKILNKG